MGLKDFLLKTNQAAPAPHYAPGIFLSPAESVVFNALSKVFDGRTIVLAKVSLAELVATPRDPQYLAHWRRVQRRTVDFLICSAPSAKPVLAIRLETEDASKKRRVRGPDVVEDVLEDIGLPLLRLKAQGQYDAADLVKKINFTLKEKRTARPADSQTSSHASQAMTTRLNATTSLSNLWAHAKMRLRLRNSE